MGDLLSLALMEIEDEIPSECGEIDGHDPITGEELASMGGLRGRYEELTEKYLRQLEEEAGIDAPYPFDRAKQRVSYWDEEAKAERASGKKPRLWMK
jgi:hypothetical protein